MNLRHHQKEEPIKNYTIHRKIHDHTFVPDYLLRLKKKSTHHGGGKL